jgi:hypothetical protein
MEAVDPRLCDDEADDVGIDRRLLLGSTVGSCWDRPSALAGIDRQLLLESTVGSCWD